MVRKGLQEGKIGKISVVLWEEQLLVGEYLAVVTVVVERVRHRCILVEMICRTPRRTVKAEV